MSDPLSSTEGSGGVTATAPLHSYGEKFEELFPYYLSLGMTEEQYWDKDCRLVIFYRKAEELRTSRKNQEMWLQGAYFYEALSRVSPLLHAFAKRVQNLRRTCLNRLLLRKNRLSISKKKRTRKLMIRVRHLSRALWRSTIRNLKGSENRVYYNRTVRT